MLCDAKPRLKCNRLNGFVVPGIFFGIGTPQPGSPVVSLSLSTFQDQSATPAASMAQIRLAAYGWLGKVI
jgi:hypothetical protein